MLAVNVRAQKMQYAILVVMILAFLPGCVQKHAIALSKSQTKEATSKKEDVQTIRLQYRISMDAVAPSQFVALYPDGMTMGLRIHWKIGNDKKAELDMLIAKLEGDGINGQEFTVKARWIYEGFELEVYEIDRV